MAQRDKAIIYVDMDHVLCDYQDGFSRQKAMFPDLEFPQSQPGLYIGLNPLPGAIETYRWLNDHPNTNVYILLAPSVRNSHCYSEKRDWVEKHLGISVVQNLIITPHKNLNKGHYLIDDMASGKGQDRFEGSLIHFGSDLFPDWASVRAFFEEALHPDGSPPKAGPWDAFFNSELRVTEDFGLNQEDRDW
ncbi:hypothetical protein IB286_14900 [Spongiibacter sp. KMU-158]|uniref:Uncharacterized protein n=1 Tax=Spongiibacter pelagi TaxID=2760804 RepID=A0A927GXL3_9GAMM|nr:hypothetical protein [Spongiibacter pelagi]MBD2860283.1 hypothetical protein [Spongiibacter pelagi]